MSKNIRLLALAGIVASLVACGQRDVRMYEVVPLEPLSVEPTFTGKFK